jgi:putative ABC transport system ATP-binding protein
MIEAINIHKYYGNQHVLKGINFQINNSQFIAIMGRSGSGKTTLLNILSGLDCPDEGNIKINGNSLNFKNDAKMTEYRQKKVGFIFQFFNLLDNLTLFDNVAIPLLLNKIFDEKKVLDMLNRVDLFKHKDKLPGQLSGGERQRGAIARALIHSPEIIFADEPTGSLDSETGESILKLLKNLHSESKATIVLVTHDNVVAKWADKIIHIRDGVIE